MQAATGRSLETVTKAQCIKNVYFYTESDLRAPIYNYNITESAVYFVWTQPLHSGLIQNYTASIRHNNGTSITSKSVGKQASFTFPYNFIPGYRYYVKIASNVQIHQPSEQFTVNSELGIILGKIYLKILRTNFQFFKFEQFLNSS